MTTRFDAIIVGAGPAGGMAACELASSGLRVLVLEKERLPRHKACGGGLPISIGGALGLDLSPVIECEVPTRKFLYNFDQVHIEARSPFIMVSRSRFDAHLLERALAVGQGRVILRDRFRVVHAEETADGVCVRGEARERIEADYLIVADGARSRIGRRLGLDHRRKHGVALDAEMEVSAGIYEAERPHATFNLFCLPYGYGWIFPKEMGRLSCGVCAWYRRPSLRKALASLLEQSFPPGSIRSIKTCGGLLPIYSRHQEIATRRVCLVGDAASLVDPLTGEGIRYALKSGALAARVIVGLAGAGDGHELDGLPILQERADCRAYQSLIHEGMGKELYNLFRFVRPIFLRAPQLFYRKFICEGHDYSLLAKALAGLGSHETKID